MENQSTNDFGMQIVHTSTKCSPDQNNICKWTIVVESLGYYVDVGFVKNIWDDGLYLFQAGWSFSVCGNGNNYRVRIKNGDVISFHLNLNNCECSLLINEHDYGISWNNLPKNVNLYPAVEIGIGARCRIKPGR